jgi:hypothetical protein
MRARSTAALLVSTIALPCLRAIPQEAASPPGDVITTVAGTSLSYHVAKPEELEGIIRDVAQHVDILWVGVEGWDKDILNSPHKIERLQTVIDLAHKHGMGVAFGLHWHSLLPKDDELADCPFAGATLNPETGLPEPVRKWRLGSEEAHREFEARLRQLLQMLDRPAEMFYQDEVIVGDPGRNFWFQPISTYWSSPTYTDEALAGFRRYLADHRVPEADAARFPVTTEVVEPGAQANEGLAAIPLNEANDRLLQEDNDWPGSPLWQHWYAWRETEYAKWLGTATTVAANQWSAGAGWQGCFYIMPFHWAKTELGQNLELIARLEHLDFICSGYMSGTRFEPFRQAAEEAGKRWGATVELCHYGKREGLPPETITNVFRDAVNAGASVINVYAGNNFRTDRLEPQDNGLYYMPEQVKTWDECVEWVRRDG